MGTLLEVCFDPFELTASEEPQHDGWLLLRLAVRSVAALGFLAVLLVAVLHAFIARYRRSTVD